MILCFNLNKNSYKIQKMKFGVPRSCMGYEASGFSRRDTIAVGRWGVL
ncbi:hypothetical protein CKA32_001479 [Geitlerinema sp. FC II]|nr:hypothetical protein CKA32_001479 [Geitlerinema sp. FC II]